MLMEDAKLLIAVCYDFDGTLSPGNMQEYDFLKGLGISPAAFWDEARKLALENSADPVLICMKLMLDRAQVTRGMRVDKKGFAEYGKSVELFPGVSDWFSRMNAYAFAQGARLEHYIISSGIREMIKGTSIAGEFTGIFASSFIYDASGTAVWPAIAVNYTNKTQHLFRINKGIKDITDNEEVNRYTPHDQRRIPFTRMVYVGDGDTDIPCMKLLKEKGGFSVAVYEEANLRKKADAAKLLTDGRVCAVASANYRKGSKMDLMLKSFIDRAVADQALHKASKEV